MNVPVAFAAPLSWDAPFVWALALGAAGLWLRLSGPTQVARRLGALLGVVGVALLAVCLRPLGGMLERVVFGLLVGITVIGAGAAISSPNPVYMAIWFAFSLLGTAGLFLFQGAQFLGVATIVVYAGAIVVTFLFVLMLAQPSGAAHYDRASWSRFAVPVSLLAAMTMIGIIVIALADSSAALAARAPRSVDRPISAEKEHMAHLGAELFARHLIAVEVAGTLLLIALVGAITIVLHGRAAPLEPPDDPSSSRDVRRLAGPPEDSTEGAAE